MTTAPEATEDRNRVPEAFALVRALDRDVDREVWRSVHVDPRGGRMFGGTTLGLVLAAARKTVVDPGMMAGSLGVHFLRPADGGAPCEFHVNRLHEGASSAIREVTVAQDGKAVAMATVAFRTPRETSTHGDRIPKALHPEELEANGLPHPARAVPPDAFDIRYHDEHEEGVFVRRLWFRALGGLPDSNSVHEGVTAFISDLYFFEPVVAQHGFAGNDRRIKYGTTQHSMWFHRAPRADEWLLIESRSPVAAGGRGLVTGEIRTVDGLVVATVVQEVAVRLPEGVTSVESVG